MITNISLVMLCHHKDTITSSLTIFPTLLFYTCDSFVLQWKSIPLNIPCLFLSSLPPSTKVTTCFFSLYLRMFPFCYVSSVFCHLDCTFISSVQFSSVSQSCPTHCDLMNRCTPGLPVHHQLPESTQTHVH